MSTQEFSDAELLGYLDEAFGPALMSEIEQALRDSRPLKQRLAALAADRDAGAHSVGEVWRRFRVSCVSRSELGGFLLGTLDEAQRQYLQFHIHTVGCRFCQANLADLEQALESSEKTSSRRQRYFESSAGYLGQKLDDERLD